MSASFLTKVADVLEQLGAQLDANEAEKTAAVRKARAETAKALSTKIADLTGEDLPADVAEKLASDESVLSAVTKLVEKSGSVESMGGASETPVVREPTTKKEALDAAYERFGSFINS
jgi:hypothetical protein